MRLHEVSQNSYRDAQDLSNNSTINTVFIPQIEWADDCLQSSGRQRNVKCMTWNEHKDKVINVICLLKCEAKKMAVAGEAAKMLDEIRVTFSFTLFLCMTY